MSSRMALLVPQSGASFQPRPFGCRWADPSIIPCSLRTLSFTSRSGSFLPNSAASTGLSLQNAAGSMFAWRGTSGTIRGAVINVIAEVNP